MREQVDPCQGAILPLARCSSCTVPLAQLCKQVCCWPDLCSRSLRKKSWNETLDNSQKENFSLKKAFLAFKALNTLFTVK